MTTGKAGVYPRKTTNKDVQFNDRKYDGNFATPQRCVTIGEHTVLPGREKAFEEGAIATMEALSDSTGFLGYMILKKIGVCAIGSFMLDPVSTAEPCRHSEPTPDEPETAL